MSDTDTVSADVTWTPRTLRVPHANRSTLIEPSLDVSLGAARQNRERLDTAQLSIQGRSLRVLRAWSRESCLAEAHEYTQALVGESLASPETDQQPIFLAGHQPSLYHPGVWVKNFAIDWLAGQSSGVGLNLIVDNDTLGVTSLRVPTGTRDHPRVERVPFAAARAVQPWEDARVQDRSTFESFADRVSREMSVWGVDPLLNSIWPDAVVHQRVSQRLCDCLTAARHRQERRWGLTNFELPISRLCETDPFLWFASHLLAQLPRFRDCHNRVLNEYRKLNGVRSRNHPVPRLAETDGWLEAPFWVWRAGEARRHGVLVKQVGREMHLSDGSETLVRLPLSPDMDACCSVEVLRELPAQGLRFRTRALTTTLFARLCLGDLFVHGIGGAKYDEMTDQIIREFYGLEPPGYLTMSATLHLPIAEPFDVTEDDALRLRRLLRDLEFNADRHGLDPGAGDLIAEKQSLIADHAAAQTQGLTRRERIARRPANRARHDRLKEINRRLAELAASQHQAATDELVRVQRQLAANTVLQNREYSFALYPEEMLRDFLQR
jgi:hypothetical protein